MALFDRCLRSQPLDVASSCDLYQTRLNQDGSPSQDLLGLPWGLKRRQSHSPHEDVVAATKRSRRGPSDHRRLEKGLFLRNPVEMEEHCPMPRTAEHVVDSQTWIPGSMIRKKLALAVEALGQSETQRSQMEQRSLGISVQQEQHLGQQRSFNSATVASQVMETCVASRSPLHVPPLVESEPRSPVRWFDSDRADVARDGPCFQERSNAKLHAPPFPVYNRCTERSPAMVDARPEQRFRSSAAPDKAEPLQRSAESVHRGDVPRTADSALELALSYQLRSLEQAQQELASKAKTNALLDCQLKESSAKLELTRVQLLVALRLCGSWRREVDRLQAAVVDRDDMILRLGQSQQEPLFAGTATCESEASSNCAGASCEQTQESRGERWRSCRGCRAAPATAVVLPCRHLTLCNKCSTKVSFCPMCKSKIDAACFVEGS